MFFFSVGLTVSMWIQVQVWDDSFTSIFDSGAFPVSPTDGVAIYPQSVGRCTVSVIEGGVLSANRILCNFKSEVVDNKSQTKLYCMI